jgi:hypothetical protein
MAVTATPYRKNMLSLLTKVVNDTSDAINAMLVTSSYAPNFDTDQYKDVVAPAEASGTGYTTGGATLASVTNTYTAANSWGQQWTGTTAYAVGFVVRPTVGNGHLYRVQAISGTGTSSSTQPTWPTAAGSQVVDNAGANQITWEECGAGVTVFTSTAPSWSSSTITAAGMVIYDNTPASNKPMLVFVNFGGNVSSTSSTFTVTPDSNQGWLAFFTQ